MTGENDLSFDEHDDEYDDAEDEYDRRINMCAQKIIACFDSVSKKLDRQEAWRLFEQFVQTTRTTFRERKKKGAHDPAFDDALLAAYDTAPQGKKTAKTNALGAEHKKTAVATQKHLRRLLKARTQFQQLIAVWTKRNADK